MQRHVNLSTLAAPRHSTGGPGIPRIGERGSAPKRGRYSKIFFPTKCICAVAA